MNSEAIGEESLQVDWEETAKQDPIGQAGSCNFHQFYKEMGKCF